MTALQAANPGATIVLQGMIWMQGESDAVNGRSASYEANLTTFIKDVRLTYGADLPFVVGQLSAAQTGTGVATYREQVRTAQANVANADARTTLVDTDTYSLKPDALHFDTAGQQALGYGFATSMQSLLVPEPSSALLIVCGAAAIAARRRRN